MTFKWPWDHIHSFHQITHPKCFKSCQTFESLTLIVFILFRKNLIFHHFWGRLTTLDHFLRHFGHDYSYKDYSILFRIENGVNNVRTSQIVWRAQSPLKFLPNPLKLPPFRVPLPRKTFFRYRKRKKRQKASHFLSLSPKNVFFTSHARLKPGEKKTFLGDRERKCGVVKYVE